MYSFYVIIVIVIINLLINTFRGITHPKVLKKIICILCFRIIFLGIILFYFIHIFFFGIIEDWFYKTVLTVNMRSVWKPWIESSFTKNDNWVITDVQMNFYFIGTKSMNKWIHFHRNIIIVALCICLLYFLLSLPDVFLNNVFVLIQHDNDFLFEVKHGSSLQSLILNLTILKVCTIL